MELTPARSTQTFGALCTGPRGGTRRRRQPWRLPVRFGDPGQGCGEVPVSTAARVSWGSFWSGSACPNDDDRPAGVYRGKVMGTGRAREGPQLPCVLGVNSFICPSGLELRLREVKSCTDPETWPQEAVSRRLHRAELFLRTGLARISRRCPEMPALLLESLVHVLIIGS